MQLVRLMQQFVEGQVKQRTYFVAAPVVAGSDGDHEMPARENEAESVKDALSGANLNGTGRVDGAR